MKDRDLSDKCYFCVTTVRALTLRNVTAQVSGIRILLRCVPDDNLNQYTSIASQSSQPSQSTFMPTYDADGNQTLVKTKTGIWQVTYNAENRPVKWTCGTTNLVMAFDRMGRRVLSEVQVNDAPIKTETYVYDGYTCILRKTTIHTNSTPTVVRDTFVWDPTEFVATRPLVWNRVEEKGSSRETHPTAFYFHDGNKNVSDVVSATDEIKAHYTYAPFGDSSATGSLAESNPWRFSSEYADDEIGCVYYTFRVYNPMYGRWMTFDSKEMGEDISKNLYGYVDNFTSFYYDYLGLEKRPSRNANRNGHHSLKGGGNWEKHSRAQSHGGRDKRNFKRQPRRRSCMPSGKVDVGLLNRINAMLGGFEVGALAVGALGERGFFDETRDWTVENDGEFCCEPPSFPMISKIDLIYKSAVADIRGPVFGFGGQSYVRYEIQKEIKIHWECCCGNPVLQKDILKKDIIGPFYETWLGGWFGSAEYWVYIVEWSRSQYCSQI